ncbi:hypothetical protein QBC40DRAFT_274154 [Triangularia verruculosa]|uniref:DUF676 domain-containing protein n=1 Tax=Triangularia verruculosa TaxID=2587418 RepID=A0AAN6XMQ1_9PEZI|nr:hypothetical protein QBC40DRAFT_274154 [Triangularia verruculosa]
MPSTTSSNLSPPPSVHSTLQLPNASYGLPTWSSGPGLVRDPRMSSTQSLVSSTAGMTMQEPGQSSRRKLLVIYIHGFMGNDSSFRSFPAHVHAFLKETLAETHVIHTKIYPRYKTYKSIEVACENFSKWLAPHESPTTDVVLVGHSMGGLLAADIVLLPRHDAPPDGGPPFRHRILGGISLDAPLLGLHPGIVVSGIASLFRPSPGPPTALDRASSDSVIPQDIAPSPPSGRISPEVSIYEQTRPPSGAPSPILRQSPFPSPSAPDPTYNPTFFNDVAFVDRGWLRNIAHFAQKHKQENLIEAAANHIVSHLEFGGCLADWNGLKTRYKKVRQLEDIDDITHPERGPRVRFVNYYTVSTGIPKKPRKPSTPSPPDNGLLRPSTSSPIQSGVSTPRISIEDHSDAGRAEILQVLEPTPMSEEPALEEEPSSPTPSVSPPPSPSPPEEDELPPIPDEPTPPTPPDLSSIPDKDSRKATEKNYKQAKKTYEEALKTRNKAIKTREKLVAQRAKQAEKLLAQQAKDAEKQQKLAEKEAKAEQKAYDKQQKQRAKLSKSSPPSPEIEDDDREQQQQGRKQRLGKFCLLPREKDDRCWVQVYMQDVDEVGAHCGLFFDAAPHYERLVGDVGERIVAWVRGDADRRAIWDEVDDLD